MRSPAPHRSSDAGSKSRGRHRMRRAPLVVGLLLALSPVSPLLAPAAHAAAPKALINGDTVSGSPSVEEQEATALGFDVHVATGAEWDAMTQAQFAQYQVLIAGDPTCG